MDKLVVMFFIVLNSFPLKAMESRTCTSIDLRDNSTPIRSQVYNHQGVSKDSRFCYAFTLANLIGKEIGRSISPESIGIQFHLSWPNVPSQPFPLTFGYGGQIEDALQSISNSKFLCNSSNFQSYRDMISQNGNSWYPALHNRFETLGPDNFRREFENKCTEGNPIAERGMSFRYYQNDGHTPEESKQTKSAEQMMVDINRQLKSGKMVALSYDTHYVTIVGRTSTCDYIIQDSIPHSYRAIEGFRNPYYRITDEHTQIWTGQSLREVLTFQGHGHFPGIGYIGVSEFGSVENTKQEAVP